MEILAETQCCVDGTAEDNPLLDIMKLPHPAENFLNELMKAPVREIQYNLPNGEVFYMTLDTFEDYFERRSKVSTETLLESCIRVFGLDIADENMMSLDQIGAREKLKQLQVGNVLNTSEGVRSIRVKRPVDGDPDLEEETIKQEPEVIGMGLFKVKKEELDDDVDMVAEPSRPIVKSKRSKKK